MFVSCQRHAVFLHLRSCSYALGQGMFWLLCPLNVFDIYLHLDGNMKRNRSNILFYKDLTKKQRERLRKREGEVSAGLPDASRQVSVHTVL